MTFPLPFLQHTLLVIRDFQFCIGAFYTSLGGHPTGLPTELAHADRGTWSAGRILRNLARQPAHRVPGDEISAAGGTCATLGGGALASEADFSEPALDPKWEVETANKRAWTLIFEEFNLSTASP